MSEKLFFGSLALALTYGAYNRDKAVLTSCVGIGILYTLLDRRPGPPQSWRGRPCCCDKDNKPKTCAERLVEETADKVMKNIFAEIEKLEPPQPIEKTGAAEAPVAAGPPLLTSDKVALLLDERVKMGQVSKFADVERKEAFENHLFATVHQVPPPPKGGTFLQMFSY